MNVELTSTRLGMLILCVYLIDNRIPACVVKHCSSCFGKAVGEWFYHENWPDEECILQSVELWVLFN